MSEKLNLRFLTENFSASPAQITAKRLTSLRNIVQSNPGQLAENPKSQQIALQIIEAAINELLAGVEVAPGSGRD